MTDYPLCILFAYPGVPFSMTGDEITFWGGESPPPTYAELDAVWPQVQAQDAAASQAVQTASTNEAAIGAQVEAALASNATFLALAGPTAVQNAAQVKALTRQMSGLIRLVRRRLDSAS